MSRATPATTLLNLAAPAASPTAPRRSDNSNFDEELGAAAEVGSPEEASHAHADNDAKEPTPTDSETQGVQQGEPTDAETATDEEKIANEEIVSAEVEQGEPAPLLSVIGEPLTTEVLAEAPPVEEVYFVTPSPELAPATESAGLDPAEAAQPLPTLESGESQGIVTSIAAATQANETAELSAGEATHEAKTAQETVDLPVDDPVEKPALETEITPDLNADLPAETAEGGSPEVKDSQPAASEQETAAVADLIEPEAPAEASKASTAAAPSPNNVAGAESALVIGPTEAPTNEIAAARATTIEPAPTTASVDPARFVSRVAGAFDAAQQRGGGPIEIRLSPPELGTIQLKIEMSEGVMAASLETDTESARNVLLDNLPALRERLAEQEIRVEKFDVNVRDESRQPELPDRRDASGERNDQQEDTPPQQTEAPRIEQPTSTLPTEIPTIRFNEDGINVVA